MRPAVFFCFLTACVAPLWLVACDDAERPEQWRVALEEVKGSIQYKYAQRFAEEVQERTEGEVEVKVYPYGALGNIEDIYEQLQNNAVHFAFGSGRLGATVPESQLFSLHFVLSDDARVNARTLNSPEFLWSDDLQQAYRERRLQLLALLPVGWQVWSANKPIRTPEDFPGVQIRIMDNRLLRETYRAYGADPTPMEYGELYGGLQQGVVDAAIQPYFAHQEMGFYEVQDYLISARQAQFVASFMASSVFYERLSREKRTILREITADLVDWAHQMQQQLNTERLEQIKQNSDIEQIQLTDAERDKFKELALPLRARFSSQVGSRGERLLARLLDVVQETEQ